ncbi:hypothetical protein [Cellulophaga sp. Z1A5H]|uniref:hypothetical protein n=1 Tax=Cellulophaga sp. Z1A5H TaxID=2687291 RepID=UPI0013FE2823|nr:hypothetical protein [Cellulophaga sp. Z1A5H]
MGLFDLFKKGKKKNQKGFEFEVDLKKHLIDNFYIIRLPITWNSYDSDRFRAKTNDGKLQMSIANYTSQDKKDIKINSSFFKDLKLELYDQFVTEGEYEPYEDLKITDDFITKSFKVDQETQYYYTTAKNVNGQLVITDIIIREIGAYNKKMQPLLQIIGKSIEVA